jgi:hypothetical protein
VLVTDLQPDPLWPTLQIYDTFGGTGAFPPASPRTVSGDSGEADGGTEHPVMVAATCASAVNDTFQPARVLLANRRRVRDELRPSPRRR